MPLKIVCASVSRILRLFRALLVLFLTRAGALDRAELKRDLGIDLDAGIPPDPMEQPTEEPTEDAEGEGEAAEAAEDAEGKGEPAARDDEEVDPDAEEDPAVEATVDEQSETVEAA
jgi:hypothetical protein